MPAPRPPMTPKPPVQFTAELKEKYVKKLREIGFKALTAEHIGIGYTTVKDHIRKDKVFAEAVEEAVIAHAEEHIGRAMFYRAIDGVEKPVIGGKFRDEVVAYEKVYSDAALLALFKTRMPEAKEDAEEGGRSGGVLIIPAAPQTMDDWEKRFGEAAKGQTGKPK